MRALQRTSSHWSYDPPIIFYFKKKLN
eukprot:UN08224